jgi:hypothetical protein
MSDEIKQAHERYERLPGWPVNPTDKEALRQMRRGIRELQKQERYEAVLREKSASTLTAAA